MAPQLHREALVTIGATATFFPLLQAALSPSFLNALVAHSYTHLTLQCGSSLDEVKALVEALEKDEEVGITIELFDFTNDMVGRMGVCKASTCYKGGKKGRVVRQDGVEVPKDRAEGVIITHAGAGTILDAMRLAVPIIVIPNEQLLDNHQAELARELNRLGYVVHAKVDGLGAALEEVERRSEKERKEWNDRHRKGGRGEMFDVANPTVGYPVPDDSGLRKEEMVRVGLD